MRCSRRSTTWLGSAARAAVVALGVALPAVAAAADASADPRVAEAILRAAHGRLGALADVRVTDVKAHLNTVGPATVLDAIPDPGARLGRAIRFTLRGRNDGKGIRAVGRAEARVTVRTPHAVARHDIVRGTVLEFDDVETVVGELGDVPLRALPPSVVGLRALRDIRAGSILSPAMFARVALVKSGDEVVARVVIDGLEVRGKVIAAQSGTLGDSIRVVNPDSGHTMRARVVGEGEVEVRHGS